MMHRRSEVRRHPSECVEPVEARRIIERFERHDTPKHGSWLNLAESELAVLSGQCLARRIGDAKTCAKEVAAWQTRRNTHNAKAIWHVTSADARENLKNRYPAVLQIQVIPKQKSSDQCPY